MPRCGHVFNMPSTPNRACQKCGMMFTNWYEQIMLEMKEKKWAL